MQMRQPAKPRPRARQRPQVQPAVVNASKRSEEARARTTRSSDPSRKIRTPVAELKRNARTAQSARAPASASKGDRWEEEPTLVQRENVLKRIGTKPTSGGRQPMKSAPPVQRKARSNTRPLPGDPSIEDTPTKVLPASVRREVRQRESVAPRAVSKRAGQVDATEARAARTTRQPAFGNEEPIALQRRSPKRSEQRWLLLLKVGKEQLARVWNQGLASCEPIVWRPTTKAWAPLFDVPQIAAFVTSIQSVESAAPSVPARAAPDTVRSPPPSEVVPSHSRRSSLEELSVEAGAQSHATLRSPYIPRAPRVPRETVKGPFGRRGEPGGVAANPMLASTARATVRPPAPAASPTPALRIERAVEPRVADTERAPSVQALPSVRQQQQTEPALAVARPDSFAPQVRSLGRSPEKASGQLIERAAWLMVGVVLALVFTLFPEVTYQLRSQLAHWIAPEPNTVVVADPAQTQAQGSSVKQASAKAATVSGEKVSGDKNAAERKGKPEAEKTTALPVEELFEHSVKDGERASDDEKSSTKDEGEAAQAKKTGASTEGGSSTAPAAPKVRAHARAGKAQPKASAGFDTGAARRALASAVQRAQFCAAERANGTVVVTFAPSGGVQSVGLASLRGDEVRKGCVIRAFRGARIRPFSGSAVTVQKSFRLR